MSHRDVREESSSVNDHSAEEHQHPSSGGQGSEAGNDLAPEAPVLHTDEPICVGYRLKQNLIDSRGTLLVRAGTVVTNRLMDLLRQWKLGEAQQAQARIQTGTEAAARPAALPQTAYSDAAMHFSTRLSDTLDQATERHESLLVVPGGTKLPYYEVESLGGVLDGAMAERQASQIKAAGNLEDLARSVLTGVKVDVDGPAAMVDDLVDRVWADPDLLLALAPLRDAQNEYLFLHAINVCTLSVLMAQHLGYDREHLRIIGLAALLHDLGMLRVPAEIRESPRVLGPDEMYEIMKHPFHTIEMLERLHRLPTAVPLIAYQVHERSDCRGYPRKRHPNMVHVFAKLIAVADAYNAMIGQRPWREPIETYTTMVELLNQTSRGRFDRDSVRALVQRIGLFPVGSVVILNTGLECIVRRANAESYVKPIVEVIGPSDSPKLGQMVDLGEWAHLEVARCLTLEAFVSEQAEKVETVTS